MDLKPIQQLLETEMDRKEFLIYVGAIILAATGIAGLTKSLISPAKKGNPSTHTSEGYGYGNSTYGG